MGVDLLVGHNDPSMGCGEWSRGGQARGSHGRSEQRRDECGWDVWSGREAAKLEGRTEPVTSVVMSADGSRIVGGSRDNTI